MIDIDSYRRNAAECVRQAQAEDAPEHKNLLLNVALAWLRLAHQTAAMEAEIAEAPALGGDAVDTAEVADLIDEAPASERHEMAS